MLAPLFTYKSSVSLIENSGIQFLDFGLKPEWQTECAGRFVRQTASGPLLRVDYDIIPGKFTLPASEEIDPEVVKPECTLPLSQSLALFNNVWLPLPVMRINSTGAFTGGPDNWARIQVNVLEQPDSQGNTVRVTVAFDTRISPEPLSPLAPCMQDVHNGTQFALAWRDSDIHSFLGNSWVDGWLRECFIQYCRRTDEADDTGLARALRLFEYQGHYLNILEMAGTQLTLPQVSIVTATLREEAIPVDLVLDVGNTHTCGILMEDHGTENDGLRQTTELQIRSLSEPHRINPPMFTSRLEFSEARLDKANFSLESGRRDAFIWPSIVRIGEEAHRLARSRLGTEGDTGISSPRRYLWDNTPVHHPWRFSQIHSKTKREPQATAFPLMTLMNDEGEPLYRLPVEDRLPVFSAQYSRSALMTLMLCELLAQALVQMNSVTSRQNMTHATAPRQLRQIILTLPSAMPKPERELFRQRMQEAIGLVWKAMGWHPVDDDLCSQPTSQPGAPPIPDVQMEWDEATCGQLVWLYHEAIVNYAGQTGHFFDILARPDRLRSEPAVPGKTLRVASLDIGGGTTDMAIVQYQLDEGLGRSVRISPKLLFREGFKVAGDDVLLSVIQHSVLPSLQQAIHRTGVTDAAGLMDTLFGEDIRGETQSTLRQQTTLQLFIPLGHAILSFWEQQGDDGQDAILESTFGELLPHALTANVVNYVQQAVKQAAGSHRADFDLLAVPLKADISQLQEALLTGKFTLTRPLQSLCEAINLYCCDVLLVTGRCSGLPGIQTLIRRMQPVPVNRIVWLDAYQTRPGCPFTAQDARGNPKSTAAVGAMLYSLASDLRLPHFNFKAADIQAYSTVRYLGILEENNHLSDENIWYHNIDLDAPDGQLQTTCSFPVRGNLRLGFRQLENARWPATPLYRLAITSQPLAKALAADSVLHVTLQQTNDATALTLASARLSDGTPIPPQAISFKLNTLADSRGATHYWIDNGSVYRK